MVYRSVYPRHFKNPVGKCTFENWLSVVSSRGGENFQGLLSQGDVWLTGVRIILHVYIAPLIMFFSLFLSFFLFVTVAQPVFCPGLSRAVRGVWLLLLLMLPFGITVDYYLVFLLFL